jgi:hypothetical protein
VLVQNGVKDAEFKKKRAESKKLKISLSGQQCDDLLKKWQIIVVPEGNCTPKNLLHLWEVFNEVWNLLYSKDAADTVEKKLKAIGELKKEIQASNRTASLISNSMQVLVAHVPRYLPKFAAIGGLVPFSQEGTERRVKESKDVLHRLTQHGQKGNVSILRHQNVSLKRKADAAADGTLKKPKMRKRQT